MKPKTIFISSAIIAAAIVTAGFALKCGLTNILDHSGSVTVRGLCEKEVPANKVTWPIVTKEMGNDLTQIYRNITENNKAIVAFLKKNGLTDDEISINPPQVVDQEADRYNSSPITNRYIVTNVLVVTSPNVDKVNALMKKQTELLKQNIAIVAGDYNYQTTYEYTSLNDIKPQMIAEATANARRAAEKFAEDSHSQLGTIHDASQGQFSIENRDQYTPYIKTIRVVTYITYNLDD